MNFWLGFLLGLFVAWSLAGLAFTAYVIRAIRRTARAARRPMKQEVPS